MLADCDPSLLSVNFLRCLVEANHFSQLIDLYNCDPEIAPEEGFDEVFFIARHAMHKELMLDFLKELCFSIDLIEALLSCKPASRLVMNDEIQKFIDIGGAIDNRWHDKDSIVSSNIAAWQRLRELMAARLSGIKITISVKKLPAFLYIELRHAFEAEDLLSVFWGKASFSDASAARCSNEPDQTRCFAIQAAKRRLIRGIKSSKKTIVLFLSRLQQ